ncbi:extracellular solute-binding protein [Candidatus Giovannonibacteria bacterium]|nr:extracellular solute-binding protein [Candidatus Giovannonibacteria bacterium]
MSKVQFFIIVFSIFIAILAVLVLSGVLPGLDPLGSENPVDLVIWGTVPENVFANQAYELKKLRENINVAYVQKPAADFENTVINALASGSGPDLVLASSDLIIKHQDKFELLDQKTLTERRFHDAFLDGADILIKQNGIIGLPLVIDPLVLYWNKDLFSNEGLASPPKTWEEFQNYSRALTKIDGSGNILESGAALGLDKNVRHYKEILSMLMRQAGNPIIDAQTTQPVLAEENSQNARAAEDALRFYSEFARPQKASYSWNSSKPDSRQAFLEGKLAMYFGLGSDFQYLRDANPHLNFDIASVPQSGTVKSTSGKFLAFVISRQSPYKAEAFQTASYFVSLNPISDIAAKIFLPPARRDFASTKVNNPVMAVLVLEAVRARLWPDVNSEKTSEIFSDMIKSVYSGGKSALDAARDAQSKLEALYNQN